MEDEPSGGPSVFLLKFLFAWAAPPPLAWTSWPRTSAISSGRSRTSRNGYGSRLQTIPPHALAALRHGIARGRTTLRWIEETRAILAGANSSVAERLSLSETVSKRLRSPS